MKTYVPNLQTDCFVFFADNPSQAAIEFTARTMALKEKAFLFNIGPTFFFRFATSTKRNKFMLDYKASLDKTCIVTINRASLMNKPRLRVKL